MNELLKHVRRKRQLLEQGATKGQRLALYCRDLDRDPHHLPGSEHTQVPEELSFLDLGKDEVYLVRDHEATQPLY